MEEIWQGIEPERLRRAGTPSGLARRLASGAFTITAELAPPVSAAPRQFLDRARSLKGLATAVNVTDGAGAKAHLSSLAAAHLLHSAGIEPVLQMTCRDRNRLALEGDLIGAMALGLGNVLILTGDDPRAGDQPETKPVFDLKSSQLMAVAHLMRSEGKLPTGTPVEGAAPLLIGGADTPVDPPPNFVPKSLIEKVEAGCDFVQTQFCLDAGVVRRYAARLADLGILPGLRMLVGLCPIPSARSALWMRERLPGTLIPDHIVQRLEGAADPRAEGKRICVELMQELATIPGVAGVHVMAPVNPSAIAEVIAESGLART